MYIHFVFKINLVPFTCIINLISLLYESSDYCSLDCCCFQQNEGSTEIFSFLISKLFPITHFFCNHDYSEEEFKCPEPSEDKDLLKSREHRLV